MEFNVLKIIDFLKDELNEIYDNYKYLNISLDEFNNLVKDVIRLLEYNYNDGFNELVIKEIRNILNKKVTDLLHNEKTMMKIINSFCNNLVITNDYEDNLSEVMRLCLLLENIKNMDIDFSIEILNNNDTINDLIKRIVEYNIVNIQEGKAQYLFKNDILLFLINGYCLINDIEITNYNSNDTLDESYYTDSLKTYLYDISREPLLTKDDEIMLGKKVQDGDQLAKNEFIVRNLRFVVSIAKSYYNVNMPFLDLIQEGNMGLMTAVEKYNPNLGIRFSTYAKYWIRQNISRAILVKTSPVKIPFSMHDKLRIFRRNINELLKTLDHIPTINEISEKLSIPVKEIEEYYLLMGNTVSLNTVVGIDENCELGDLISKDDGDIDEKLMDECFKNDIHLALESAGLNERERSILVYRYGLNQTKIKTLYQLAKEYNITHERVRQIECSALEKIKKSEKALRVLAEYSNTPDRDYNNMTRNLKTKKIPYYKIKNKIK